MKWLKGNKIFITNKYVRTSPFCFRIESNVDWTFYSPIKRQTVYTIEFFFTSVTIKVNDPHNFTATAYNITKFDTR